MRLIKTEDAVGHVLCHDLTQIIKDQYKDARFRKGHVVTEEDIPVLLSMGKEHLYVWEMTSGNYVAPQVPDAELNKDELAKSVRINKVKGFIYGYHIGNLLSVSKEQGFRVKTTQTLLDLASAVYGSIDKKPTPQQKLQLQQTDRRLSEPHVPTPLP